MGAPLDVVARKVEARYSDDWKPLELTVDATIRGQALSLHTTVSGTTATSEVTNNGQSANKTDTIGADARPDSEPVLGTVRSARDAPEDRGEPDRRIAAYAAPVAAFDITVGDSTTEEIQTPGQLVTARRTAITMATPHAPIEAELWSDARRAPAAPEHSRTERRDRSRGHRVGRRAPRDDLARQRRAGDDSGQRLLARRHDFEAARRGRGDRCRRSCSSAAPARRDRDEDVYGIPIFGQLAVGARRRRLSRGALRQARRRPERRPRGVGDAQRLRRGPAGGGEIPRRSQGRRRQAGSSSSGTAKAARSR